MWGLAALPLVGERENARCRGDLTQLASQTSTKTLKPPWSMRFESKGIALLGADEREDHSLTALHVDLLRE